MANEQKFFICKHCGNLAGMINNSGVPMICCGEKMTELIPNTSDGAGEKHLPVIHVSGNTVTVEIGSTAHPMLPEHYIQWIYLNTEKGGQRKSLAPGQQPKTVFLLTDDDKPAAAFAYCNIHGLWKTEITSH